MSTRIAATLALDTQGFTQGITQAEAEANTFAARLRTKGVGLFSGKSAQESAGSFSQLLAGQERLAAIQKANAFARLTDEQKLVALEREVVTIKSAAAAIDGTNLEKIQLEIQLEEKLVQLDRLRLSTSASRAAVEQQALQAQATQQAALDARRAKATAAYFDLPAPGARAAGGGGSGPAQSGVGRVLSNGFGFAALARGALSLVGFASIGMAVTTVLQHIQERAAKAAERIKQLADEVAGVNAAAEKLANYGKSPRASLADLEKEQRRRVLRQKLTEYETPEAQQIGQTKFQKESLENDLAQRELKKKIYDEAVAKLEAIRAAERAVSAEQYKRFYDALSNEQKLTEQRKQQAHYESEASKHSNNALLSARFSLAAEESKTEQARLRLAIFAETEAAWDRELAAIDAAREAAVRLYDEQQKARAAVADAQKNVTAAQQNLATAKSDALGFTPEQLTRTPTGRRDTTATGLRAASILRDEAMASSLRRSGRTVTRYDAARGGNFEADAEFFQTRAGKNRDGFDPLKSSEQRPFAQAETELKNAAAELKQAAADLKDIEIELDTR